MDELLLRRGGVYQKFALMETGWLWALLVLAWLLLITGWIGIFITDDSSDFRFRPGFLVCIYHHLVAVITYILLHRVPLS